MMKGITGSKTLFQLSRPLYPKLASALSLSPFSLSLSLALSLLRLPLTYVCGMTSNAAANTGLKQVSKITSL